MTRETTLTLAIIALGLCTGWLAVKSAANVAATVHQSEGY